MDSVVSPVHTLCLHKSKGMNSSSSLRHSKCVLAFIPLSMTSSNKPWNSSVSSGPAGVSLSSFGHDGKTERLQVTYLVN